jgi:amino acid permease
MLAMPYAIRSDGVLLGIFVILLSASTSAFGLYLQGKCSKYVDPGQVSFFALAQLTYPQLSIVFDLAIAVKCFGVGISYLVVIGDLMPKIAMSLINDSILDKHEILLERNFWITLFMITIVVPLSFLKKLDSLKYASMVALSSVVYLVILVFIHFLKDDIVDKGPIEIIKPFSTSAIFASFPIFVFAYTCHQNMFSLVNELEDKSGKVINKVIGTAIGTAMTLYVIVGVTGYLTFGDNVQPNVIVGYPQTVSSTVGRIAIVILVMLSYPLQCHPARASINHIMHFFKHVKNVSRKPSRASLLSSEQRRNTSRVLGDGIPSPRTSFSQQNTGTRPLVNASDSDFEDELLEEGIPAVSPLKGRRFIIITSMILLFSYLIAISVTSLAHVLAFVGSTGSTSISFILPGIFGYQLIGSEYIDHSDGSWGNMPNKLRLLKYLSLCLTIWGFLVMVVCLSATIFLGASH